jgi:ABC-type branched-subunit amino acid transport system permease subunit
LPEAIRFLADYREITNGLILLLVVIFAPAGIAGLWQRRGLRIRI